MNPEPQRAAAAAPAPSRPGALAPALALASCATLGFEILLTRVFAIALWHHFAAMVVSIAMLGLAAGGAARAAWERRRRRRAPPGPAPFALLGASMAGAYLAAIRVPFDPALLAADPGQLLHVGLSCALLSLPFLFAGVILAAAFSARGERAGVLYAADLCGAAAGALLAVLLQFALPPGRAILLLALAPLGAAALLGGRLARGLAAALAVPVLALAAAGPAWIEMPFSPSKELPTLLRAGGAHTLRTLHSPWGRIDVFASPGVRFAPGLSLRYDAALPEQVGLAVDGGAVTTATLPAPAERRRFIADLPAALPFLLRPGAEALLVEPRGGLPWLLARELGARHADCTGSNPALARVVRELLGAADAPCGGRVAAALGRNVARRRPGRYDVIDLALTDALPVGVYGAGEDYALTVEAFEDYLAGLGPQGLLSVNLYLHPPYRAELRLFALALRALEKRDAADPPRHLAAVRSLETLCLLVKRSPFTPPELEAVRAFARERWFDPLWPPQLVPAPESAFVLSRQQDLAGAFAALADPARRKQFARDYLFDLSAPTDERPYLHFALRLDRLREIYELVQRRWDFFVFEGYLLPAVLLQVAVLGLLFIGVPALVAGTATGGGAGASGGRVADLAYFAALGGGYLFVEIALLQRLVLPLESALAATAVALAALLVGSGVGALIGQRVARPDPVRAALAVALAAAALALTGSPLARAASALPSAARILAAAALLVPVGALLGLPFPWGIRLLHQRAPALVPWAWAVNGYVSVLAPLAAALLATRIGVSGVLGAAALLYAAAALVAPRRAGAGGGAHRP